jgi:hypothetical protein
MATFAAGREISFFLKQPRLLWRASSFGLKGYGGIFLGRVVGRERVPVVVHTTHFHQWFRMSGVALSLHF